MFLVRPQEKFEIDHCRTGYLEPYTYINHYLNRMYCLKPHTYNHYLYKTSCPLHITTSCTKRITWKPIRMTSNCTGRMVGIPYITTSWREYLESHAYDYYWQRTYELGLITYFHYLNKTRYLDANIYNHYFDAKSYLEPHAKKMNDLLTAKSVFLIARGSSRASTNKEHKLWQQPRKTNPH